MDAAYRYPSPDDRLPRIYRFLAIALYTAGRRRAIEGLRWSQVDLKLGLITFLPTGTVQTSKRRPTVPISNDLMPILQMAKEQAVNRLVMDTTQPVSDAFQRVCKAAGVVDCTPHTLRHTWATQAAQKGVSMVDIADMLGDTVATVEKTYRHACPQHLRRAVNFWGSSDSAQPTA
jgi:integrase